MKRIMLTCIILLAFFAQPAYPYWIWTPKTGKFVNPKQLPKASPKEQFDYAMSFYEAKKFEEARQEFQKLLKAYPKTSEAAEAQFYLGRVEEERGNIYEAYLSYQKLIDTYPFSQRIQDVNEREFAIAEKFMSGEAKRKAFGVALPVENPSVEIFTQVIENSTYGPLAAKAQYKLGLVLKSLIRFYEAEDAFNKLITNYPDSEWVEAAKFQIASCRAAVSRGADYDQGATEEAKAQFEEFVKSHPDAVLSAEAEKNIQMLKDKEVEATYTAALFYEKQKESEAAKLYYSDILTNYPESPWAAKAKVRLDAIAKMQPKRK